MANAEKLVIGTRGSKLALLQAGLVADALQKASPGLLVENKIIVTQGDINQSPVPDGAIGKAWFTEEIEQALLSEEVDIAVHSLKDLPPDPPVGLRIIPVLQRADVADVLVSKSGLGLQDLSPGAVIGTDSVRRRALILAVRPDLVVRSIRGNVDTRFKKMETEGYDAIVLAAAGLERLGLKDRITERFDPAVFVPAPGQGILAVEIKEERLDLIAMIEEIIYVRTSIAADAERAFSNVIGGGCKVPIGCYADVQNETITVYAAVGSLHGGVLLSKSKAGSLTDGKKIAEELAAEFLGDEHYEGKRT